MRNTQKKTKAKLQKKYLIKYLIKNRQARERRYAGAGGKHGKHCVQRQIYYGVMVKAVASHKAQFKKAN